MCAAVSITLDRVARTFCSVSPALRAPPLPAQNAQAARSKGGGVPEAAHASQARVLIDFPNIGKFIAGDLRSLGVHTPADVAALLCHGGTSHPYAKPIN